VGDEVACNPHAASISLHPPPVDEGDPFNNDGAAHNPHAAPRLTSFTPLIGGDVLI
jgi:hypothetical protein